MAHSIQVFRGKHVVIDDIDLIIVMRLGLKTITEDSHFEEITPFIEQWADQLKYWGPGVIDLKLDQIGEMPTILKKVLHLLDAIRSRVCEYGETIPQKDITEIVEMDGIRFYRNYEVRFIKEAISKLQDLLNTAQ